MARTPPTFRAKVARNVRRSYAETRRWLKGGGTFWIWLALAAVILILCYTLPGELHNRVRWAGTIFELLGIGAIIYGIDRARRSFGRPFLLHGLWMWIAEARFIFIRRPPIIASATLHAAAATFVAEGGVVRKAGTSTEERIAILEKETSQLRNDLVDVARKNKHDVHGLREDLTYEAATRDEEVKKINQRLEEGLIGDSHIELAGVAFLLFGLPMANASDVVAVLLGQFGIR